MSALLVCMIWEKASMIFILGSHTRSSQKIEKFEYFDNVLVHVKFKYQNDLKDYKLNRCDSLEKTIGDGCTNIVKREPSRITVTQVFYSNIWIISTFSYLNILNAFKIRPILLVLLRVEVFHTEAKIELIVTEFNLNKLKICQQSHNFAKC